MLSVSDGTYWISIDCDSKLIWEDLDNVTGLFDVTGTV